MKLAITVARVGNKWTVLEGPSNDILGQKALFKKIRVAGGDHEKTRYEEVLVLGSGNLSKHARFATKEQEAANAKSRAAQQKEFDDAEAARARGETPAVSTVAGQPAGSPSVPTPAAAAPVEAPVGQESEVSPETVRGPERSQESEAPKKPKKPKKQKATQ